MKNEDFYKHRGEYLNWLVRKKGIKISVLTKLADYDRSTFYNHIKDPNLPFTILMRYGHVLGHNFATSYPELAGVSNADLLPITTFEEMEKDRDKWKNKYEALVDLWNKYLEEREKR